ncbi:DUF6662 family protein [Sphingomonas morindae]|uniref:Uncharacterized protein n=1 Tax=Sphingomonas morindae TaxID=1541170 RepID=A0ABY4XDP5_9SPHN|nr:DUF6662 family protein [Sphingomonas morindae]USI74811.1 hypothetical protein LHA26_18870 [Sphingomonas morindae]
MSIGTRLRAAALSLILILAGTTRAWAGEGMFSRAYTTDLTPAGHFELEQVVRTREGRAFGQYDATDFRSEFEYGVTDNFQASLYLNTNRMHATRTSDDDDELGQTGFTRHNFTVQSVSAEFVYRLLSPYKNRHGWGLAVYLEPEYDFHDLHNGLRYAPGTFALETRVIVQKNFMDDRLIMAYNLVLEAESIRFAHQPDTNSELDWNNELGVTYRVAPKLFVGAEFRNHNEYGNFTTHEHSVFWAGPAIHYASRNCWATLGWLRQFAGNPGHDEEGRDIGNTLFLRSHERNEVTFKLGLPF